VYARYVGSSLLLIIEPSDRRKAKKPIHLRLTLVPTTSNKELSPKKEDKPRPPPPSPKKNLSDLRLLQKKPSEVERPKPIPAKPKALDPSFDIDESLTKKQTNKNSAQETDSLEAESPPVARAKPAPKPKRPTPKAREARTPNRYTQRAPATDPIIIISDEEEGDTELGEHSHPMIVASCFTVHPLKNCYFIRFRIAKLESVFIGYPPVPAGRKSQV